MTKIQQANISWFCRKLARSLEIIPSQMEVAPLHRTVDIRQKRRLLKNTKETKKILEG